MIISALFYYFRVVLVGEVKVDLAVDSGYDSLAGVLPHAEVSRVGRNGVPLRKPYFVACELRHIKVGRQPGLVGVQHAVVACRVHFVKERLDDLCKGALSEVSLALLLNVEDYGVGYLIIEMVFMKNFASCFASDTVCAYR